MEHNSFALEFQLPEGKGAFQTAQKDYQLKIQSFCKCYLQYTCCLRHHLYHEWNTLSVFVILIWSCLTLQSFFLKGLCTRLLILDLNRSCGIEVWSVEKSNVWTDVAVRTSSWSSDDNELVQFFRIQMLSTPLRLVLVLQNLINPSFMVLSTLVRRHDRSFVVHLLEPAINLCLYGDLCSLGVQYRYGRFWSSSDISNPTNVMNWLWLFTIVSNELCIGINGGLLMFTLFIPNSLTRVSI